MMSRCISFLRSEGYPSAWLWVLRDNPRARTFYEKAGWTFTGGEKLWYGPQTASPIPEPLTEVQYFTALTATR
jgi:ribosomal protein S18 acetylase RimI-like enzyme